MRFSSSFFPIVVLQMTFYTTSTTAIVFRHIQITCPKPSDFPNCKCNTRSFHYPKQDPTVEVELLVEGLDELHVTCYDNFGDFASLPNLDVGFIKTLFVTDCMWLTDRPLLESISFVGLYSFKEQLKKLELKDGVEYIESDYFSILPPLQELIISGYDELRIQPNISLNRNRLRELTRSTFEGLENLPFLNLRYSKIECLSTDAFALLSNLNKLHLSFNSLTIISGNLTVNRKLKAFYLSDNETPLVLSDYLLSHLPELQTVILENSKLRQLPENLFRKSKAIIKLNLSSNELKSLPESFLQDQSNIMELYLQHNRLETLPEQLFTVTRNLILLQLSSNQLISVSGNIFAALSKLRILNLDNNNLHFIDDITFKGTTSLEQLYLQNNRLTLDGIKFTSENCLVFNVSKHSPLQYLKNLRVLNLRNNSVTSIFHDWQANTLNLSELDLSYNAISRLSGKTDLNFSSEINVDLSNNRISHISELNLGRDMSQVKVSLNGNPLNCDCHLMEFLQYKRAKNKSHIQFITDNLRCSDPQELIGNFNTLQPINLTCTLTGDNTGCPSKCNCITRPANHTTLVNCTGQNLTDIWSLPRPSIMNYSFIQLHIENNRLKELPNLRLSGYEKVVELHARNNFIERVSAQNLPPYLRLIDLTHNKLNTLSKPVLDALNNSTYLANVQLSNNNWTCDCSNEHFVRFVQENQKKLLADTSLIICEDGRRFDSLTVKNICDDKAELNENVQSNGNTLNVLFLVLGCSGLILGILSAFYYYYQIEIKVWLFTHKLFLWFVTEEELDKDKLYDAFISYSHKDALFIERELVPWMETQMNFKICIHERDWIPGEMIPEQIISSVENSRRTVIVLSKHYLQSSWAQLEFRTAHLQSLAEGRIRVIIIMFSDIGDVDSLDPELKAYLKMNTYVKHGDPWFWDKLRYAMPHPVTATELKKQRGKRRVTEMEMTQEQITPEE